MYRIAININLPSRTTFKLTVSFSFNINSIDVHNKSVAITKGTVKFILEILYHITAKFSPTKKYRTALISPLAVLKEKLFAVLELKYKEDLCIFQSHIFISESTCRSPEKQCSTVQYPYETTH